jgi:hypothetical protein
MPSFSTHSPVYVFREPRFAPAGDTVVCAAPLDLVVSVYGGGGLKGEGGLSAAFGGAISSTMRRRALPISESGAHETPRASAALCAVEQP